MIVKSYTRTGRILTMSGLLAALIFAAAACNTVKGIGEDVSAAGQGLADVADDVQD